MKVILFGATGMVERVVLSSFAPISSITATPEATFSGYDACCFCLGVSVAGLSEPEYHRLTYELTIAAAAALGAVNPGITFCYVSGEGTDSTERGRSTTSSDGCIRCSGNSRPGM